MRWGYSLVFGKRAFIRTILREPMQRITERLLKLVELSEVEGILSTEVL